MAFVNPPEDAIEKLLRSARTIAVVGLSDNPRRPSYEVSAALLDCGYQLIPVNPALAVWEGIRAVPDLDHAVATPQSGQRIDIVNVFRQPRHVDAIVADCIRLKLPALWLQLSVVNEAAAHRAIDAGIAVVMNRCIKTERMRMD
jgi:uncharacterized protein